MVAREPAADAMAKQERNQYVQWWTAAESLAYYNVLKDRFKTTMMVAKPVPGKVDAVRGSLDTSNTQ